MALRRAASARCNTTSKVGTLTPSVRAASGPAPLKIAVLDISDPANLVEAGYFLAPKVFDVCVQENYAYLASADWDGGFVTVDISDPTNPVFVSTYNEGGWFHPFDVAVQGDYAYVGDPVGNEFLLFYI